MFVSSFKNFLKKDFFTQMFFVVFFFFAQSAGAAEYTDCTSTEG